MFRYRVYLENDDYEDNDSSMENSRVLKNSSLEQSKVLKSSSLENSTVLKNLTLENSRLVHLDEPELGQGQPGKPLPVSRKGSITFGNTKLNSENPFPKNGVKQNLKQKAEDQIKPKEIALFRNRIDLRMKFLLKLKLLKQFLKLSKVS